MPNIIIKDEHGNDVTYNGAEKVAFRTADGEAMYQYGEQYSGYDVSTEVEIRWFDYDGTLLYVHHIAKGGSVLSYPPNPPAKEDLTFYGWNYLLSELTNLQHDIDVGALYRAVENCSTIATDEHSEARIHIRGAYTVTVHFCNKSAYIDTALTFDWGDGTVTTGTVVPSTTHTQTHTYASGGVYDWSVEMVGGGCGWGRYANDGSCRGIIVTIDGTDYFARGNMWFEYLRCGGSDINHFAFSHCYIASFEMAHSISSIGTGAFEHANVDKMQMSNAIMSIGNDAFKHCYVKSGKLFYPPFCTSIGNTCQTYVNYIVYPPQLTGDFYPPKGNPWLRALIMPRITRMLCGSAVGHIYPENFNSGTAYIGFMSYLSLKALSIPPTLTVVRSTATSTVKLSLFEHCQIDKVIIPDSVNMDNSYFTRSEFVEIPKYVYWGRGSGNNITVGMTRTTPTSSVYLKGWKGHPPIGDGGDTTYNSGAINRSDLSYRFADTRYRKISPASYLAISNYQYAGATVETMEFNLGLTTIDTYTSHALEGLICKEIKLGTTSLNFSDYYPLIYGNMYLHNVCTFTHNRTYTWKATSCYIHCSPANLSQMITNLGDKYSQDLIDDL